ncbi:hypothetical protein GFL21_25540 [Rhizobium anhuiense]|nr:hypothetical protein [Rhizobium anhuiense]
MCLGILLALECQTESGHEGILLWLIGIPIPIIILLYFFHASEYRRRSGKGTRVESCPQAPPPGTWSIDPALSFFRNRSFRIAARRARGRRLMPLGLNYSDSVQIFAMAFAERISMAAISRRATPGTGA